MRLKTDLPQDTLTQGPKIDATAFVAKGAVVVGHVTLGKHASVWYNAVVRGDINAITIGDRSNIQDGSVIHVENDLQCIVGQDVTVGHKAVLHACTIEDGALIGMGAIVLNGAKIGKGCVIAAGAVVKEGTETPPNTLWAGVPAKLVKHLPDSTYDTHVRWAKKYVDLAHLHQKMV